MDEPAARPPVPGFQPASTLPRHVPSTSSHRNATNILPPVPAAPATELETEKEKDETPVAGPSKPVQRPTARKNAIVFNAVQVSSRCFDRGLAADLPKRRNPVRASVKNVAMEIGDIPADFQVGTHNGVLFLRWVMFSVPKVHH
jgi:DNA excision repair protein ERCC-1